jgi:hypothetical protein
MATKSASKRPRSVREEVDPACFFDPKRENEFQEFVKLQRNNAKEAEEDADANSKAKFAQRSKEYQWEGVADDEVIFKLRTLVVESWEHQDLLKDLNPEVSKKPLPFYKGCWLVNLSFGDKLPEFRLVVRDDQSSSNIAYDKFPNSFEKICFLDGTSPPVHETNYRMQKEKRLAITNDTVEEYLDFFCMHVHSDSEPFAIIETDSQPIKITGNQNTGEPIKLAAVVCHKNKHFEADFEVERGGMIRMVDDSLIKNTEGQALPKNTWRGLNKLATVEPFQPPDNPSIENGDKE